MGKHSITFILGFLFTFSLSVQAQDTYSFEDYIQDVRSVSQSNFPTRCYDVVPVPQSGEAIVKDYYCPVISCLECTVKTAMFTFESLHEFDSNYPNILDYDQGHLYLNDMGIWTYVYSDQADFSCGEQDIYDEAELKHPSPTQYRSPSKKKTPHSNCFEDDENKHD